MEGIKTVKVINDLELEIRGRSITLAGGLYRRREIGIAAEELPALLAALETAAGEMGITTTADKYRALCVEILDDIEGDAEMTSDPRWENWRRVLRANLEEQQ